MNVALNATMQYGINSVSSSGSNNFGNSIIPLATPLMNMAARTCPVDRWLLVGTKLTLKFGYSLVTILPFLCLVLYFVMVKDEF